MNELNVASHIAQVSVGVQRVQVCTYQHLRQAIHNLLKIHERIYGKPFARKAHHYKSMQTLAN